MDNTSSKQPINDVINAGVKTMSTINNLEESIVSLLKIACNYYDSDSTSFILINENYISTKRKFEYVSERAAAGLSNASNEPNTYNTPNVPVHITIDQSGSVTISTGDEDVPEDAMLIDSYSSKSFFVPVYSYAEFCGLLVVINAENGKSDFLKTTAVLIGEVLDKNADASHIATQQFYHSFESVYIVNLDNDMYRIIHRREWVWDAYGNEVHRYSSDMGLYIDTSVHEEDRKLTHQMLDSSYIKKNITKEKTSFAFPLRDMYTGNPMELECRVIKADETEDTHIVILTFRMADWEQRSKFHSSRTKYGSNVDIYNYETIIPQRLSKLRELKGNSARDMSLSIGQNASYINNIENGKSLPSMSAFFCICDYLDVTPMEFFQIEEPNPSLTSQLYEKLKNLPDEQLAVISKFIDMIR